jgi:hypothetical protein
VFCARFDSGGLNDFALARDNAGDADKATEILPTSHGEKRCEKRCVSTIAILIGVPVAEAMAIYSAVHFSKHHKHTARIPDPGGYVSASSLPPYGRLNVPSHKHSNVWSFLIQ